MLTRLVLDYCTIFGLDVGSVAGDSFSVLRALTRCGGVALAMWASLQKLEQRRNKTSANLRFELPRSFKFDNSLTFTEEEFFYSESPMDAPRISVLG